MPAPPKPPKTLARSMPTPAGWRSTIRSLVGPSGENLWRILYDLAEGKPYTPTLANGMQGEPIVPTAEVRLQAARDLADRLFGKAVAQTEIVKGEAAGAVQEGIHALSDGELKARVLAKLQEVGMLASGVPSDGTATAGGTEEIVSSIDCRGGGEEK